MAQYAGAKQPKMVNHVAAQTLTMVVLVSIVLSAIAYQLSPNILYALGVQDEIFEDANFFQKMIFAGLVFNFGFIMFQSLLRGVGEVKIPLYINAATFGLNFILDPLFIYGWGSIPAYGVTGAAVSTLCTLILSSIIGHYILFKGITDIKLSLKRFKFDGPLLIKALKIGGPSSIEISARALGLTLMTRIAAKFGTDILAAYGVGSRLISFVVIFGLGLLRASSTIVGQNMGAGQIDRAEKGANYAAWIGFVALSFVGIVFYTFAHPLVKTFMDAEPEVVQMGVDFLKIVSLSFGFMGAQLALVGTLRGSGNTVESMVLTIIGIWVIQFPFAWITSEMEAFQEFGVWWSFPVSYVIPCILTLIWFKRGKWKEKKLVD